MIDIASIREALTIIQRKAGNDNWVLGGSAGLLLRGLPLFAQPRDIDLYCDGHHVPGIHQALREYATDEPLLSETDIYQSTLSHYEIGGLRVELVGGFRIQALGCCYTVNVDSVLARYGTEIVLDTPVFSAEVTIVPLAHELWFNVLRQRNDRVSLIAEAMSMDMDSHKMALSAIEENNFFPCDMIDKVHRRLGNVKEGE